MHVQYLQQNFQLNVTVITSNNKLLNKQLLFQTGLACQDVRIQFNIVT